MTKEFLSKNSFAVLLALVILLNATALFNEIMDLDGTLYASIAKHIAVNNNWMNLLARGTDWLDKPHMPFWLAAASFKTFGINSFAYKLPSFVLFVVSVFYCYKLAAAIYTKATAQLATLIYATALHIIISNFDGKAEIYLTAFVIAATYHLFKAQQKKRLVHIIAAAVFSACAVMTKGIFALITIAAGFVIYWIKTTQWKEFIQPKWYLLVVLVLIFITPELYSLYTQFDLHPEKIVFDKTNVSGIKFFFWDSQFGRFFNNGPIKGSGDLSFFVHTTLWAFLPWAILFVLAVIHLFKRKKNTPANNASWIIGGTALVTFLLFSLSKFQLPHYIIIVFPHFAMITASYLTGNASEKVVKAMNVFQTVLFLSLIAIIIWLITVYSFSGSIIWFFIVMAVITLVTLFYQPANILLSILKKNIGFALLLAIFLNCVFYPSLLQYQAGMMAGKWLNSQRIVQPALLYNCESSSFDFYYNAPVFSTGHSPKTIDKLAANDSLLVFSDVKILRDLPVDSLSVTILKTFPNYRVSQLNGRFINYKTRASKLDSFAVAWVKKEIPQQ